MTKLISLFTCILALSAGAFGQSEIGSASLNGTVTDATGAAVPAAGISARNTATGLERATQTSEVGHYTFAGLPVGTYDVTVDAKGFKTAKRTAVQLMVGSAITLDNGLSAQRWRGNVESHARVSSTNDQIFID